MIKVKNLKMAVARVQKGLSQKKLAALVGTKPNYISKIENGISTPSLKMAKKIAGALEASVDELFGKDKSA